MQTLRERRKLRLIGMLDKQNSIVSQGTMQSLYRSLKLTLIALLMVSISLISGCTSRSHSYLEVEPNVVPEQLMVTPNFTKTLLDTLSVKPSEPIGG